MDSLKKKQKSKGKWHLFQCFKPEFPVDDNVILRKMKSIDPKSVDPLFSYIVVAEKQHVLLSPSLKSCSGEENASRRKKLRKEKKYSIRRVLMSAMNHTPLAKKMSYKHKTSKNNDFSPESSSNLSNTTFSLSSLPFTPSTLSSCSTNSSSTTSTSTQTSGSSYESYLPSSMPINEIGVTKLKQNIRDSIKGYFGNSNMGMCLLLITSLMVLIMCGKCCAIAYTSIGFFMVPNYWRRPCDKRVICAQTDFSTSIWYKK